jgi:nucleoside-diphosphate-sugar epimerase
VTAQSPENVPPDGGLPPQETVLVTGGAGFIGGGIARRLAAVGCAVRSLSRRRYPELEAAGITSIAGDLTDREAVLAAAEGCSIVFHVAALAGYWGRRADFERTNIAGTESVLAACRAHGIDRLVFTSSPSVTFAGRDQQGVDESEPYPDRHLSDYPRTKAIAERAVRAAADGSLATVSLRPHLVWGPGDPHFLPRLVERARAGRLKLVGDGSARVDSTYIDNAVDAHLAAASRLRPGAPLSGRAYFISNGEPIAIGTLIRGLLDAAGIEEPRIGSVPGGVAFTVGALLEGLHRGLRLRGEPAVTRFVARQLATDHWFDLSGAQRDFGWSPRVSNREGFSRLRAALAQERETA